MTLSQALEIAKKCERSELPRGQACVRLAEEVRLLKIALVKCAIPLEVLHGQPCKYHTDSLNESITEAVMGIREAVRSK